MPDSGARLECESMLLDLLIFQKVNKKTKRMKRKKRKRERRKKKRRGRIRILKSPVWAKQNMSVAHFEPTVCHL